ncbi:MAG: hypothetical protein ACXVZR_03745 [Terriglobales bacterium]
MNELPVILQLLNVLIVPALVYVVRIDRRMGQIDAVASMDHARIDQLEKANEELRERLIRLECRAA